MNQQYKDIDIIDMAKVVVRLWWFVMLVALVGASLAFLNARFRLSPLYESHTVMFVGKEASSLADFDYDDLEFKAKLIGDYKELLKTRQVYSSLEIKYLMDISYREYQKRLFVEGVEGARFMNVGIYYEDPEMAALVANKMSEVLIDLSVEVMGTEDVKVVDEAVINKQVASPSVLRDTLVGFIVGSALAFLLLTIRYVLDDSIDFKSDVSDVYGVPIIGDVPYIKNIYSFKDVNRSKHNQALEHLTLIAANLQLIEPSDKKVLMFTSPDKAEGKTFISYFVGRSLAEQGFKVLHVDCDFLHMNRNKAFRYKGYKGLTHYLSGYADLGASITRHEGEFHYDLIASGSRIYNPSQLINSTKMQDFVADMKKLYDYIIFDTPSVLKSSDGLTISKYSDRVIAVVESKVSKEGDLFKMIKMMHDLDHELFGLILNKTRE